MVGGWWVVVGGAALLFISCEAWEDQTRRYCGLLARTCLAARSIVWWNTAVVAAHDVIHGVYKYCLRHNACMRRLRRSPVVCAGGGGDAEIGECFRVFFSDRLKAFHTTPLLYGIATKRSMYFAAPRGTVSFHDVTDKRTEPNRTKRANEPTICTAGYGGATKGGVQHFEAGDGGGALRAAPDHGGSHLPGVELEHFPGNC